MRLLATTVAVALSSFVCRTSLADVDTLEKAVTELLALLKVVTEQRDALTERVRAIEKRIVPAGAIAFFDLEDCPPDWSPEEKLRGRYVVGVHVNSLADVGKVRGDMLQNLENRPTGEHQHKSPPGLQSYMVVDNLDLPPNENKKVSIGNDISRLTTNKTGGVIGENGDASVHSGTNAPYVQLLACRKNQDSMDAR